MKSLLAKARAARPLAEHERDQEVVGGAIAQSLFVLRSMGRQDEAEALAEEVRTRLRHTSMTRCLPRRCFASESAG